MDSPLALPQMVKAMCMYVASTDHKVQKFNRRGEVVKSVGENGGNAGEFDGPFGVKYHNDQVYGLTPT